MNITNNFKKTFQKFHNGLLPSFLVGEERKTKLFYASFYLIVISTFLTIIGQLPFFTVRSLTQLFQVGWLVVLIPLMMLDYKKLIRMICISMCIVIPFFIYCLVALLFGIHSIQYGGTIYLFLSLYIFILGSIFGKYKTEKAVKTISLAFIAAAFIYAIVVYVTKLRGYDLENQIYAFGDKNSSGPIFMTAAILSFIVFNKRKPLSIIIRWLLTINFVFVIVLSKNRAISIIAPLIIVMLLIIDIKSIKASIIIIILSAGLISLFFIIPWLRDNIIIKILFNNKTNIDDITSGRISQIIYHIQNIKPILGRGGVYFDCMPLSLLCSYGTIGLSSIIPVLSLPILVMFRYFKCGNNKRIGDVFFVLIIMFLVSSLFEGFGYIGTGAKVFILWLFTGLYSYDTISKFSEKKVFNQIHCFSCLTSNVSEGFFILCIQSLLLLFPILMLSSSQIITSVGSYALERIPESNKIANYVEVKDIQIDPPVSSMCVGQKITYGLKVDPINAEDSSVYWSTGWVGNGVISVNGYTGEVIGNKVGTALLHINRYMVGPNGVYIQFGVKDTKDYSFDKLYISSKEYNKSFEHTEDETITITKGCTKKMFYDSFYLPDSSLIEYVSSNNDVAIIENNSYIRALSSGNCEITAKIHDKNNNISINKLHLVVTDSSFTPATTMSFDNLKEYYQYQECEITPTFNTGATDTNYNLTIDGLEHTIFNNKITFLEYGKAKIRISSLNNPLLKSECEIEVKENHPVKFECDTKWITVGETKNAENLGLKLVFSNGYKKTITEKDISFDSSDFTNHAWSDRNGLVGNRTTIKAVKKGIITINYVSAIDNNITGSFNIRASVYTQEEYNDIVNGIGCLALSIIASVSLLFSVFVQSKHKIVICILLFTFASTFLLLFAFKYGVSLYFYISLALILIALLTSIILRISGRTPYKFLETPME